MNSRDCECDFNHRDSAESIKQEIKSMESFHRLREWTYGYWVEGWRKGIDREFGVYMCTQLYLKCNKDLLYSYCIPTI